MGKSSTLCLFFSQSLIGNFLMSITAETISYLVQSQTTQNLVESCLKAASPRPVADKHTSRDRAVPVTRVHSKRSNIAYRESSLYVNRRIWKPSCLDHVVSMMQVWRHAWKMFDRLMICEASTSLKREVVLCTLSKQAMPQYEPNTTHANYRSGFCAQVPTFANFYGCTASPFFSSLRPPFTFSSPLLLPTLLPAPPQPLV